MHPSQVRGAEELGKSTVSIAYKTKYCFDDSLCVDKVVVKVISGKSTTTVDLSTGWGGDSPPDVRITVNGEELNDPSRQPFDSRGLLVKKASSVFASVEGFGFRLLIDPNGRTYIYLEPFYSNKVFDMFSLLRRHIRKLLLCR